MTEITKEYASALFSLALEGNNSKEIYDSLITLDGLFSENPDYALLLASPGIPKAERVALIEKTVEGMPEYVCSFLCLLTENGHIESLHGCIREFELLYKEAQKQSTAFVRSAVPLTEEQKSALIKKLEKKSGHSVSLECTVDESLIAGIIINMDDTVIDGSVKRQLRNLKEVINE